MISVEAPKIFQASRCVFCRADHRDPESGQILVEKKDCLCPEEDLLAWAEGSDSSWDFPIVTDGVTAACSGKGCTGPRALIPLVVDIQADDEATEPQRLPQFLCMCGLRVAPQISKEVLLYKSRLIQDILGATLANARLYENTRRRSLIDPLTGLKTRRVLEMRLVEERERGIRRGSPFCVAILDVDSFKKVNDDCGHEAGDQVLRKLAEILRAKTRASDLVARFGGDEFVVVMSDTELDVAGQVLERVRAGVEEGLFTPEGGAVTISCGVAAWSGEIEHTGADVLRSADTALRGAKQTGRNSVVIAKGLALISET